MSAPPEAPPPRLVASRRPHRTAVLSLVLLAGKPWLEKLFWPLDLVDLAFHEAGHPIFGLLGVHFITVLGGTLMQLLMPAAALLHFLKRGEKASAFACLGWFGQNFLGIGRYMGDARAQQLELIGSGEHDWTTLFETMGLLTHDVGSGGFVVFIVNEKQALVLYRSGDHSAHGAETEQFERHEKGRLPVESVLRRRFQALCGGGLFRQVSGPRLKRNQGQERVILLGTPMRQLTRVFGEGVLIDLEVPIRFGLEARYFVGKAPYLRLRFHWRRRKGRIR